MTGKKSVRAKSSKLIKNLRNLMDQSFGLMDFFLGDIKVVIKSVFNLYIFSKNYNYARFYRCWLSEGEDCAGAALKLIKQETKEKFSANGFSSRLFKFCKTFLAKRLQKNSFIAHSHINLIGITNDLHFTMSTMCS